MTTPRRLHWVPAWGAFDESGPPPSRGRLFTACGRRVVEIADTDHPCRRYAAVTTPVLRVLKGR